MNNPINYFCTFKLEPYLIFTNKDATRDSTKKNNKLSKVDWGITIDLVGENYYISMKTNFIKKSNKTVLIC